MFKDVSMALNHRNCAKNLGLESNWNGEQQHAHTHTHARTRARASLLGQTLNNILSYPTKSQLNLCG